MDLVRKALKEKGMLQSDLAKSMGLTAQLFSEKKGNGNFTKGQKQHIYKALKVNIVSGIGKKHIETKEGKRKTFP